MQTASSSRRTWQRLAVPLFAVAAGLVVWAAEAIGGDFRGGVLSFGILALYGAALYVFGQRSDVVSVLAGTPRDERYRAIDLRAVAFTGFVLILWVIGGFLWEQAHGRSGMPYTLMGAVAGLAYLAAVVYGRVRG